MEPITTIVLGILGAQAQQLLTDAAKDHAKDYVKRLFTKGEQIVLGNQEKDALEDAYQNALTHANTRIVESLGNVLQLMVSQDELKGYADSIKAFLKNDEVAEHLLETVRDPTNKQFPDPAILEREWRASGGEALPIPGVWMMVASNFRKITKEKAFVTPRLREVINARNLDQIRQLGEKLLGVQITVKHEQYVNVMRKTFAPVQLANVAPSYADDPGALVVTDIFEPQHVRENPPPVEIEKSDLEKLIAQGKLDKDNEAVVLAMLDEGDTEGATQKLRYQMSSYAEQPVRQVLDVISPGLLENKRLVVITGEPGSGKSTLLRYLLLGILDPPSDSNDSTKPLPWTEAFTDSNQEHFPFLIELRDYHFTCEKEDKVNSLMDYARYQGKVMSYGIDDRWLDQRLKSGHSLVMFDGLDEIFNPERREHVMKQIVGFSESYSRARIIVTSRPHGYHDGILRPAGFAHYRLQDLDREQKERFTRTWFGRVFPNSDQDAKQRIERVLGSVDRSPSVRWLAGNPLLLTIMCMIAREKELPRERARFYEQCIDVLAHQWDLNNHLKVEGLEFLDVEDKKSLLRRIAFEMQGSEAGLRGNFISEKELLTLTQAWFEESFTEYTGLKARTAANRMVRGLWQRNYLLCPRGPNLYGFLHRTFMEFLTAAEYVWRFEKTDDFTIDDLDAVFRTHGNDPDWSEVLRLICGEIGDEYAEHLIRTLFTMRDFPLTVLTENDRARHVELAIRCMNELRNLGKMRSLGKFAIEHCVEIFRVAQNTTDSGDRVLGYITQAAREVGRRWPARDYMASVVPSPGAFEHVGYHCFPEFEATILGDRERITRYSNAIGDEYKSSEYVRISALQALSHEWPDDETRQLLQERALQDENEYPRIKALELLAANKDWADHDTRQLLQQRALQDESEYPRIKALELLAANKDWADHDTR